jgi:hypothetical protein
VYSLGTSSLDEVLFPIPLASLGFLRVAWLRAVSCKAHKTPRKGRFWGKNPRISKHRCSLALRGLYVLFDSANPGSFVTGKWGFWVFRFLLKNMV